MEKKQSRFGQVGNCRLWFLILQDNAYKMLRYTWEQWCLTAVNALGILAGAFTATYLYSFAVNAAMGVTGLFGIHSEVLGHLLAISGVLPTVFLWANDARTALNFIVTRCLPAGRSRVVALAEASCSHSWLLYAFVLLLLALTGAFSESRMAYYVAESYDGWYPALLMVFTPIAFAGIYGVSVIELTNKFMSWFRSA